MAAPGTTDDPATRHTAIGMAVVLVVQLMLVLDNTVVNVALPRIDDALHFGPADLSWVLNAYSLAFGGLLLTGGRLGDVFGRRRVLMIGVAVFTAASLAGGAAGSGEWLVTARAVQGLGAALSGPGVLALLVTNAPDETARNRALGLFSAVSVGGGTLGLLLGGVLTDLVSWRWTLFVNVPVGAAVLLTVRRYVRDIPRRPGAFDVVGAVSATVAAVAVVWSLIGTPEHGWASVRTTVGLATGAVALLVLVLTERRVAHPMLRPALLRSRSRVGALAVMTLIFGAQFAMFFLLVQYLQIVLGLGPLAAGLVFVPLTVLLFVMAKLAPGLVARYGQAPLLGVGTVSLTAGYLWLGLVVSGHGTLPAVIAPMLLLGFAAGTTFMPATSLALRDVEPGHAGAASGLLQTAQQIGGAIGLAVVVSVYANRARPGEFLPGTREAFLTAAGFTALAFVVVVALIRRPGGQAPPR